LPATNVFGDAVNFPVGLTSQSVGDGYYVMLRPLPVGTHSLHFTGGIKMSVANDDPADSEYELDVTYNLTVTPPSLTVVPQGGKLVISWPQTSTSYSLQETGRLSPAHWAPSGATVQAVGAVYQVIMPASGTNQFFRLQKQ
jgi:hypothetical protein